MTVEFLVATMNRENLDFLDTMFSNISDTDYKILVINQCNKIAPPVSIATNDKTRCISTTETGISNSRNMAINNALGDICVICDDDTIFEADCISSLLSKAVKYPEAEIYTFKIITPDRKPYKRYPKQEKYIKRKIDNLSISSIEIAFKREAIIDKKIRFYNWLGLGTDFSGGEEICFIRDCITNKLKVVYINEFIVSHPIESSGKNFEQKSNALANGAIYAKLYPCSFSIWNLYFAIKRYKIYKHKFSLFTYFGFMQKGSFKMLQS